MAKKTPSLAHKKLKAGKQNKWFAIILIAAFILVGVFLIYRSFAGGTPVFTTDPDYWRPRIAQCESGWNYANKKNPKYRGAFQFDASTWRGAVGPDLANQYPDPADAPPAIQDQAFNTLFARRGTQPWNSSYSCWIKGATAPSAVEGQVTAVANATSIPVSPPAKPFGVTSGSYNVVVNGRVTLNDAPLPNVVIATCSADRNAVTDADGRFFFGIPAGGTFCLHPISGVPAGATLVRTANNVEHSDALTFESQIAGVNCYRQFWCFLSPSYTWDRSRDSGYNFFYSTTPAPTQ